MSEQDHSNNVKPVETTDTPVVAGPPKQSRAGFYVVVIFLLLMATAIAGFLWLQYKTLNNVQANLAAQVVNNNAARQALETKVTEALLKQQQSLQSNVADLAQRQESTAARVQSLSNTTLADWKLTEANYLLRMANQRILLEHETSNALALAESANVVLSELESPELFPVRKKLAEEIQAVKMVAKVDREGIFLQLLALTQQIDNLPLIEPLIEEDDVPFDQDPQANSTIWERIKNMGKRTMHNLSSYVRVRDQGRRVDAILPPEDQMYLKQNLRLMLEQAQTGLLREEQNVYQASLDKAQNWIRDYYPLNEQADIVLNDLELLKKNIVQHALPDFSGSATLIKDYIQQKDKLAIVRMEQDK